VVDTVVKPPATPPSDDTFIRKPRRRWLWWLIAAFLAILLAAISTGVVLVANYQPFKPGYKQYGPPTGVSSTVMRVPWLGLPPNLRIFSVPAEEDLTFNYRFSIWNHGPVPITVTRIGIPESERAGEGVIIEPVAIYPDAYKIPELGGEWRPVQPFRLEPRQMAGVEMQVTITDCQLYGRWNAVPVTFEMYGIERHVLAPTNVQIDMIGPQPGCE
jgi:hypothetical protein